MRVRYLIIGLLILAGLVTGCGGSDGEGEELSKVEYLTRADAICKRTDKKQEADLGAYAANLKPGEGLGEEKGQEEKVVLKVGLPPLREQVEELREIPVPEGAEDRIQAIYEGIDAAIETTEADPGLMLDPAQNPFNGVEKQARAYGFKVCGAA